MSVDILQWGGFKDGEIALDAADAASNPYYGGSPAKLGASGAKLATSDDIIGVFQNNSVYDLKGDIQIAETVQTDSLICTVIFGCNKLRLIPEADGTTPWTETPTGGTYSLNDPLYVGADGLWDNDNGTGKSAYLKIVSGDGLPSSTPTALDVYQAPILI